MIDIAERDRIIVREILSSLLPSSVRVSVFGSRARGKAQRGSDLDLAIDVGRSLTMQERGQLEYAFAESCLPYTVDIVDLHAVDEEFRAIIEHDAIPFVC